jgi:anti-anti-sigma factor
VCLLTRPEFSVASRASSVLAVSGELDIATVPALESAAHRELEINGPRLVLDLDGATFIDSTAYRLIEGLAERARREGGELTLVAGCYPVQRLFQLLGAPRQVRLVPTVARAQIRLVDVAPAPQVTRQMNTGS